MSSEAARNGAAGGPLDEFIGGPEAALVPVAADAVLAKKARYNPIVLCGPTGAGKSHLAQGLAKRWRESRSGEKAIVLAAVDFARSFANAVETDTVPDHRARFVQAGLFVLDGLEELAKKPAAQQELIHTLDEAIEADTRVLVTSREPLGPVSVFLPGLASRLSGGFVVPMALPGPEARLAILHKMLQRQPAAISHEAVELLAAELPGTADELRHAVLQLCEAEKTAPVEEADVRDYLTQRIEQRRPTMSKISSQVARRFRLKISDLHGKTRRREVVQARGVAMLLARQLTGASYETVGRHFGGRDHSTVMHACRRTTELLDSDPALQRTVEELAESWNE
ncbi:MAG: ATP-binding protein [Planctomycetes bacterium]|nr:ATP-binding protein [Planctomycetota bacterium]